MILRAVLCCGSLLITIGAGALWLLWALMRNPWKEKSQTNDVQTTFTPPGYEGLEPETELGAIGRARGERLLILPLYSPTFLLVGPQALPALTSSVSPVGVITIGLASLLFLLIYAYAALKFIRRRSPGGR